MPTCAQDEQLPREELEPATACVVRTACAADGCRGGLGVPSETPGVPRGQLLPVELGLAVIFWPEIKQCQGMWAWQSCTFHFTAWERGEEGG